MTTKSPYELNVPPDISKQNLIGALTKILPGAYAHRYGGEQLTPEEARSLAENIVSFANRCEESNQLRDVANRINLVKPTPKQCADFKNWFDQLVLIQPVNTKRYRRSPSQIFIGLVWKKIKEDWGGYKEKDQYGDNVAVGIR